MRIPTLLLIPVLSLAGAVRTPVVAPGSYAVNVPQWRAEALREPPTMTVNGVTIPLSVADRDRLLDGIAKVLASGRLEVAQDGTYTLTTPMVDFLGTWAIGNGELHASPTVIHPKAYGLTFHSDPFSIRRDGTSLRLTPDGKPSESIPIERIGTTAAR